MDNELDLKDCHCWSMFQWMIRMDKIFPLMFDRNFSSWHYMAKEQVREFFVIVFLVFDIWLVDFETKPFRRKKKRKKKRFNPGIFSLSLCSSGYFSIKTIQLSMHELIDKATCLFSLVYWCSSFLSLDCTYSLEIYSYATTEYANMIQLSNYGCVCVCEREREREKEHSLRSVYVRCFIRHFLLCLSIIWRGVLLLLLLGSVLQTWMRASFNLVTRASSSRQ